MNRKRTKGSKKFNEAMAKARLAKEAKRLAGPAPDYRPELPMIRRRVVVEDYDLAGQVVQHVFILSRCDRRDCYAVSIDGVPQAGRMGWARVLVLIRKAFVRLGGY